ncbi:GNAT family N-acetyltransferase [Gracilibacillus sp. Marseille-QA3620]
MITELQTKRLILRKIKASDSTALFKIWSDREVTRFMNITRLTEEREALDIIAMLDSLFQEGKAIRYSIIHAESNQIIGSCGFNFLDFENLKTEIGYELGKEYWGKGYAGEAINCLVDYAFHTLHFNRVEAKVEPENSNSIRLLEKLHFQFEGTLRKSEKSKGLLIDLNMYSKLITD